METFLEINFVFLWIVALLNLFLTLALILKINAKSSNMDNGLKKGEIAPDFVSKNLQGNNVNLAAYDGWKAAFLFVSPRCNACHELLRKLKTVKTAEAKVMGIHIVLVIDATLEEAKEWVEDENIQLPVLVASKAETSFFDDYRVQGTPSYCLINENGKVEVSGFSDPNAGLWKKIISSVKPDPEKPHAIGTMNG